VSNHFVYEFKYVLVVRTDQKSLYIDAENITVCIVGDVCVGKMRPEYLV